MRNTGTKETLPALKDGWMVHFTSKNPTKLNHYWKLTSKYLVLYQSNTDYSVFSKISLDKLLSLEPGGQFPAPHTFQLRTNTLVFYVGDKPQSAPPEEWALKIKKAMMPLGRRDEKRERTMLYTPLEEVFAYYQIFPDAILGAGQFGVVYEAIHRPTGKKVCRFPPCKEHEA